MDFKENCSTPCFSQFCWNVTRNLDESLNCFLYYTNRKFVGNPALLQLSYKNKIGESRVTELQQNSVNARVLPDVQNTV
jgi:predicted DsbA family dithiol-disulfide isomerase